MVYMLLTLPLLVLGVLLADDPDDAFASDHLAVLAQLLDGRPYFHRFPLVVAVSPGAFTPSTFVRRPRSEGMSGVT
jgi:hypothetical protein